MERLRSVHKNVGFCRSAYCKMQNKRGLPSQLIMSSNLSAITIYLI